MVSFSAVITAAGRNSRMEKSQIENNIPVKNKLLLPFDINCEKSTKYNENKNENNDINNNRNNCIGKTVIETTVNNVLFSNVEECIVVLGHFADEIKEALDNISDARLKIVKNEDIDIGLSSSLLNGVNHCNSDFVLCVASDQPTVTSKTYKNLINIILNSKNIISILRRKDTGFLNTAEGLGMPFIANKDILTDYLKDSDDNLNPILRKIFKDGIRFYGVKEENELELININNYNDYKFALEKNIF